MALAESTQPGPPPGLDALVNAAGQADEGISKDAVDLICKDMMQRTDELLQEKVDKLLSSAAGQLQTAFERQQEQVNSSLEAELKSCREKVKSLEADKEQMHKTVTFLQEQFAALSAQIYSQCYGWQSQVQKPTAGSCVNAGMMGPFATFPAGLPNVPTFPAMEPVASDTAEVNTTAPPSPYLAPSTPATPLRAPISPPCVAPPPPPPGLGGLLEPTAMPVLPPAMIPAPPGLTSSQPDGQMKGPSAAISLCAAINATPDVQPVLEEKVPLTPEEMHRKALEFMQSQKDSADLADVPGSNRFASPSPLSPTPRVGPSPSRNMLSPKYPGLNTTPKRTPRLSNGKMTPGMKSPAITASPFVICESGGTIFGFTIRKADDCSLGLDVNHTDTGNCLQVTGVKPGGAMQAWNKQCAGGPAAGKAVMPGDRIVKVNNTTTPKEMLQECREQKLLKFTVQRGDCDDGFDPLSLSSDSRNRG